MFPLYTTGTGAQTGLKLAKIFHEAKSLYQQELLALNQRERFQPLMNDTKPGELDPIKCEQNGELYEQCLDKVEETVGYGYEMYHAASRQVIDEIRDVQGKWIDSRNQRFQKAEQVF